MNNKGLSTGLSAILVIVFFIAVGLVLSVVFSGAANTTQEVTVYIDSQPQNLNYTQSNPINWVNPLPGFTYTKNFTVASNSNQNLTLILYTTEPSGSTQTWAFNHTLLQNKTVCQAALTLSLATTAQAGSYTWRLLAVNGTAPIIKPPEDNDTEPVSLSCTIKAEPEAALKKLNVTIAGSPIPLLKTDIAGEGYTVNFTSGETIRFAAEPEASYQLLRWDFSNHNPSTDNPLMLANVQESFTITVKLVPTP